mmetsp:Transcript_28459/g.54275  ORF Transcript_28459/g.54275 Transcript_28459/m.54275 type:complete len:324 (-) Transcript_28459:2223-3194(-)
MPGIYKHVFGTANISITDVQVQSRRQDPPICVAGVRRLLPARGRACAGGAERPHAGERGGAAQVLQAPAAAPGPAPRPAGAAARQPGAPRAPAAAGGHHGDHRHAVRLPRERDPDAALRARVQASPGPFRQTETPHGETLPAGGRAGSAYDAAPELRGGPSPGARGGGDAGEAAAEAGVRGVPSPAARPGQPAAAPAHDGGVGEPRVARARAGDQGFAGRAPGSAAARLCQARGGLGGKGVAARGEPEAGPVGGEAEGVCGDPAAAAERAAQAHQGAQGRGPAQEGHHRQVRGILQRGVRPHHARRAVPRLPAARARAGPQAL